MNVSVLTISPRVTRSSLSIPDDLIFEIFSRLPSKAIMRFRCISKLWASILRNQDFTESFLIRSFARPQLLFACEDDDKFIFFSSPHPQNPEENSYVVAANHLERFPSSYRFPAPSSGFSCYGFNLIMNCDFENVICNPSTGQSLILPRLKSRNKFSVACYLGYEPIAKEFKVLSMERSCESREWISVKHQVLTLGTNKLSWRMLECCIPHYCSHKWICINGVIYYEAPDNWSSVPCMVACFDLSSEKLSFVNFMETTSRNMPGSTTLINYNGKLGLLMSGDSNDVINGSSKRLELWVLQDAGKMCCPNMYMYYPLCGRM
ncbi:F-box protein [Raphanus sativus]|nr:F-box protein [Raphanus sativus]